MISLMSPSPLQRETLFATAQLKHQLFGWGFMQIWSYTTVTTNPKINTRPNRKHVSNMVPREKSSPRGRPHQFGSHEIVRPFFVTRIMTWAVLGPGHGSRLMPWYSNSWKGSWCGIWSCRNACQCWFQREFWESINFQKCTWSAICEVARIRLHMCRSHPQPPHSDPCSYAHTPLSVTWMVPKNWCSAAKWWNKPTTSHNPKFWSTHIPIFCYTCST